MTSSTCSTTGSRSPDPRLRPHPADGVERLRRTRCGARGGSFQRTRASAAPPVHGSPPVLLKLLGTRRERRQGYVLRARASRTAVGKSRARWGPLLTCRPAVESGVWPLVIASSGAHRWSSASPRRLHRLLRAVRSSARRSPSSCTIGAHRVARSRIISARPKGSSRCPQRTPGARERGRPSRVSAATPGRARTGVVAQRATALS